MGLISFLNSMNQNTQLAVLLTLQAVRRDNKQRFSLVEEDGELLIRANQGHSITTVESDKLLKPILSPEEAPVCVHGTYKKNLESILASGLKRMNRLHVHFSCGLPTDGEVISGMRRDVNVLIFLDIKKALEGFRTRTQITLYHNTTAVLRFSFLIYVCRWDCILHFRQQGDFD
ncbi:BnaC04g53200D [Brassica napus]|uniref:BnaC04g53200D protein n=1 Tax=Brassica napus TaxID=3708 RepID=A0A078IQV7_BRANA|nr:BnaC04g53200D [Brassica napus]